MSCCSVALHSVWTGIPPSTSLSAVLPFVESIVFSYVYFHGELLYHSLTLCDINTVHISWHRNGFKMLPLNQSRRKLFILLSLHLLVLVILYRVHTGRKPKTFWSWWFLAQPALLSQMMCSAPTAQNPVALQRLPLHAYLTMHQKSFLAKL